VNYSSKQLCSEFAIQRDRTGYTDPRPASPNINEWPPHSSWLCLDCRAHRAKPSENRSQPKFWTLSRPPSALPIPGIANTYGLRLLSLVIRQGSTPKTPQDFHF